MVAISESHSHCYHWAYYEDIIHSICIYLCVCVCNVFSVSIIDDSCREKVGTNLCDARRYFPKDEESEDKISEYVCGPEVE